MMLILKSTRHCIQELRFGSKAHVNIGTLLKISSVTDEAKRRKLNRAAIHSLNEERSVCFMKYEIHIRGK